MVSLLEEPSVTILIPILVLVLIIVGYVKYSYSYWKRRNVPYIEPTFPFGSGVSLFPKGIAIGAVTMNFYEEFKRRGYTIGGVYMGVDPKLVLMNPDLIKDILIKDFQHFTDRGVYQCESDPISVNIFAQPGSDWRNARVKLTSVFTSAKMKQMFQLMMDCSEKLELVLEKLHEEKTDVDILEVAGCYTTDVVGSCAFGIACNSFKHSDAEFRRMGWKIFNEFNFLDKLNLFMSIYFPNLSKKLGVRNIQKDVSHFFFQTIQDTVNYRESNSVRRNDLLQLLIDLKNSDVQLSMNELIAQVFLFFAAGFETSSTTTALALFEISKNEEVQEKLRKEIWEVLKNYDNKLTYEALAEMKYLGQAIEETLRVWPPVTTLTRVCVKDYKFKDTDVVVEKGTHILIPVMAMQRDPQYWPDPMRWDPDRFNEKNKKSHKPFTYLPFGDGPRNCIGLRFGVQQTKIALVTVLNKYRVKLSPKTVTPEGSHSFKIDKRIMALLTDNFIYDLLLLTTTFFVVTYAYFQHCYAYWEKKGFPYLTPKFPLGNSHQLLSRSINLGTETAVYYNALKKKGYKFGGIYTITNPLLVIVDPNYVRDILSKDFQYFIDRGLYYNEKDDPISAHLFALDADKWKNIRSKLTPTFTSGKIKLMFNIILDISKHMEDALDRSALENSDIDLREHLACFTTDVIGACAFGINCNSFKGTEAEFRMMGQEIFKVRPSRIPHLLLISKLPKLALKLGIKGTEDHVSNFFYEAVEKAIKYREDNKVIKVDFLQLLIDMKNKTKDTENPFTMDQLVSQVFLFFIAGFDTSSATMNFAIYELCKNQDIQDKVREEINGVLENNGGDLTYENLADMKYLDQVIDEALRLYPPVTNLTRSCVKDYKLRDTDLVLETGTKVIIPLHGIHRDPEYYPAPDKFDPDRFSAENKKTRHPFVHLPFGEGPRNCIGLRFGLMQSKIGLATILSKFRLKISPATEMPLRLDNTAILIKTLNTLYVTAEKI